MTENRGTIALPVAARSVEFAPETIIIDGQPLPWPLNVEYGIDYHPHPLNKTSTVSFAVLAETVTGLPDRLVIDGRPVPWLLAAPSPHVSRFKSRMHSVSMTVIVDAREDEQAV